jgi:uncharacterized alpha-E superfamily protein
MLSRVAGNVYWMARYLERAENTARIVNVTGNLLMDLPKKDIDFGWEALISITGSDTLFQETSKNIDERSVVKFLLAEKNNPDSILSSLQYARENLRITRDIIPREAWEQLNDLYLLAKTKLAGGLSKKNRYEFLKQIILGCQQISGILYGTMSRNMAYNFIRLGCYLERGDMTTRILDVRSANLLPREDPAQAQGQAGLPPLTPFANIQWMSVLKSLTAYQMYRQHASITRVRGAEVLRFLLQNNEFPRSLRHCLDQVEHCLRDLPRNEPGLRAVARLQRQVLTADMHELAHNGLHGFIDEMQVGLAGVHDQINLAYLGGDGAMAAIAAQTTGKSPP